MGSRFDLSEMLVWSESRVVWVLILLHWSSGEVRITADRVYSLRSRYYTVSVCTLLHKDGGTLARKVTLLPVQRRQSTPPKPQTAYQLSR